MAEAPKTGANTNVLDRQRETRKEQRGRESSVREQVEGRGGQVELREDRLITA